MTDATRMKRATAEARTWLEERGRALRRGLRPHLPLYAVAAMTYGAGLVQSALLGIPMWLGLAALAGTSILLALVIVIGVRLMGDLVRLWRAGFAGSPTLEIGRILCTRILTPGRVANGGHAFLATGLFAVGFATIKSNIPIANPFSWDETFMRLDRALHFGVLPHERLAPFTDAALVTLLVNLVYNGWFLVLLGFFLWQGFRERDTALRQQFLLAYVMSWAIGTCLLGTIFSSAGPCFYGRVVGSPDPYAGMMSHLREVNDRFPLWALTTQEMLWRSYVESKGTVSGISAMPSMHVGTSVVFLLCAHAAGIRWLTWFCAVFALAILLGSIALGWHYAVDGYAGALIALGCWWLAGGIVRRGPLSSRPS